MGRIFKYDNPENPYSVETQQQEKKMEEMWRQELIEKGYTPQWGEDDNDNDTQSNKNKDFYGDCDHPNTMENSTATILWIVAMIISLLFKGGWALCILETIAWVKFITRHDK